MKHEDHKFLLSLFIIIIFFFFHVESQTLSPPIPSTPPNQISMENRNTVNSLRPGIAIVIGVLSIMFSLTFLLLIYAKFCHGTTSDSFNRQRSLNGQFIGTTTRSRRFSGIDKTVIESLPFFRFSSLKGLKEGLECAVCLSKFEDTEILRLLPICKHAFHLPCVDQWLESHSSCPLCRRKVDPEDDNIFTYTSSTRFSRNQSDLSEDPNLELFVRRELDDHGSSRFSVGSSFRMMVEKDKQDGLVASHDEVGKNNEEVIKQEIIVSDIVFKNRWSDASPSDLISLNSDMLDVTSNTRFSSNIKDEFERRRYFESKIGKVTRSYSDLSSLPSTSEPVRNDNSSFLGQSGRRAMSEITKLSRFADVGGRNRIKESSSSSCVDGNGGKEEKMRRLWVQIARRTVEWIAGRERKSRPSQYSRQLSVV